MTLRAKNGRWEYRFQLPGEPRVTKLTDLEATDENRVRALKLEQQHRDEILKGKKQAKRQKQIGFSDAADLFMQTVKMEHIESTAKRVATSLVSLRLHFGVRPLASIRPVDIENYKAWRLNEHKVQPITLRHDLDNLSKMFKWARRMDLCTTNPTAAITKPSGEAERVYVVSPTEEKAYFTAAARYPNLHDVARIILLQGMRPDEVLSLRKDAVDLEAGTLTVIQGKTRAARRTLRLRGESRSILAARMVGPAPWVFPSPKTDDHLAKLNGVHNKALALCVQDWGLYALRHTFATRAAASGMDLTALAAILGHASLRCVSKYVHVQQSHMDAQMARLDTQAHARPTNKSKHVDSGRDSASIGKRQ